MAKKRQYSIFKSLVWLVQGLNPWGPNPQISLKGNGCSTHSVIPSGLFDHIFTPHFIFLWSPEDHWILVAKESQAVVSLRPTLNRRQFVALIPLLLTLSTSIHFEVIALTRTGFETEGSNPTNYRNRRKALSSFGLPVCIYMGRAKHFNAFIQGEYI